MNDNSAAWVVPAGLGVAFLLVAASSDSALRYGWLVLGLASFPVAWLRWKAARR